MTSKFEDGGPAFPNEGVNGSYGMSLRDYFAAKAIGLTLIACVDIQSSTNQNMTDDEIERVASNSYRIADAMLAKRRKREGEE